MDDQRSEILPRSRGEIEGDIARFGYERPRMRPGDLAHTPVRRSRRRVLVWLLLAAAIAGAGWYFLRPSNQPTTSGRSQAGAPTPVGLAPVQKGEMPVVLNQLGTVTPLATVTVKTQINGYLTEVAFQEGQMVKKGDFLAQIDPRPYQVALEQAQAQLAKDQASLANAELDLKRYNTLVAQNSIATQTRDTQVSTVGQDRAQVMLDQAQIDTQKLNLTYCHIISPVTGRVGLRQVDAGNYVQTSDANGIVVVTQLQPISVIFTVPEDNLSDVFKRWHGGAVLAVTAYDRSGAVELDKGTLNTIDNQIDTTTGTVKLRAIFNNENWILFPNQFVNVQLVVDTVHDVDIVPSAAIQRGAPGVFVYLVKPDHTVAVQKVKLGPTDGRHIAILSGLEPGESIVVDGTDRLRDGAKVTLASAEQPSAANTAAGQTPPASQEVTDPAAQGSTKRQDNQQGQSRGQRRSSP